MKILKVHLAEAAIVILFFVLMFVLYPIDGEEVIEDMSYIRTGLLRQLGRFRNMIYFRR